MNKLVILIFGLTLGLFSPPAALAPVEKIAFDTCGYYEWGGYYSCYIQVANVDGTGAVSLPAEATEPAWSPDGSRIAFSDLWGNGIYVWSAEDGTIVPLDTNYYYSGSPTWAPDGQHIAFSSSVSGSMELYAWHADGTPVTQLTNQAGVRGGAAWSPDGTRIAFDCEIAAGNGDICALELSTGAITRLTTDPGSDAGPAWSPDGTRLAFGTMRFGGVSEIAVMNADGTAVARLGSGIAGRLPAWSPNGNRIAFQTSGGPCDDYGFCLDVIYRVNVDGTGHTFFGYGFDAAWTESSAVFGRPTAYISYSCTGLTCEFNGNGSWDNSQISSYSWVFSDGGSGTGGIINHAFPIAGTYSVTLTVVDNEGLEGTTTISIPVVIPPTAVIAVSCSGLTCTYDGTGSSDADGTIVNYMWGIGDTQASGPVVTRTYAQGNYHQIWLRVTDNSGASSVAYSSVTVSTPPHVADLDGSSTSLKDKWTPAVNITVHDENHQAMVNVTVNGTWSTTAPGSCVTNGIGQCAIYSTQQKNSVASVTFTISGLQVSYGTYNPAANHDPDGDSNGTRITIKRR